MEQAESSSDSPRVFTREKWFVQLGMAACGIACCSKCGTSGRITEIQYSPKIKAEHLARKAIVYLRQSSDKQVRQNKESQRLQYDVAERMRVLGWKEVEIINCDLGSSAAIASARRDGFERVLSSVADCPARTKTGAACWRCARFLEH
jgi:hypothetical protein